jgi:hypothetical protein
MKTGRKAAARDKGVYCSDLSYNSSQYLNTPDVL